MKEETTDTKSSMVIIVDEASGKATTIKLPVEGKMIMDFLMEATAMFANSQTGIPADKVFDDYVFIRKDCGYKKVTVKEISHLDAGRNYCDIYLADGTHLNVSMPMAEVHEYLPPDLFKRVHRSFVVNMEHIDAYIGNMLVLKNGKEITIGREYRETVAKEFTCIGSRKRVKEKNREKEVSGG